MHMTTTRTCTIELLGLTKVKRKALAMQGLKDRVNYTTLCQYSITRSVKGKECLMYMHMYMYMYV